MVPQAHLSFRALFGADPTAFASAPGRVNVIGEHTDYNGGYVLPAAIPQRTCVELRIQPGNRVDVWSREMATEPAPRAYSLGTESPRHDWLDYIRGVTRLLTGEGYRLSGFQLRIESSVPVGSGLSSSAALEISVLRALREAFALPLNDMGLAALAHRVETEFVGAPVGIMDQMACSLADESRVLFLDTRTLVHENIPLPDSSVLIVIDSGVAHRHAAGDYRVRRAECDRAAALLEVAQLRDVENPDRLATAALPPPLDRRARHVVTENARVLAAVEALRAGDLASAGVLLSQSHASMRDDFEISVPEIDRLVAIAERQRGVFGARLTGGGFGGSIVALADRAAAKTVASRIAAAYAEETGRQARVLVPALPEIDG